MEIVNKSNHNPNKLLVDQGREFYNKLMQEWLENNDILMYSTHNEGKSVIAERFLKTLKAKLVDQYNNTYHHSHSINKKIMNVDYSALTEKIETNL